MTIPARLASTSKTFTGDATEQRGSDAGDDELWKRKSNANRIATREKDVWQAAPANQKRTRKNNTLLTQFALDVVSNRDTVHRSDLSIRKKSKNVRQGYRTRNDFQYSKPNNVRRIEDDGLDDFEDIVGMGADDSDGTDEDGDHAGGSVFLKYKRTSPIGLFMLQADGYNNSCAKNVLENRTKYYDAETDDANVNRLVDCLAEDHNVPLDILAEGVKSLCKVPDGKLDALVGLQMPYLLPQVVCRSVGHLASDVLRDVLLAMSRLHCKLSSDEVKVLDTECRRHLNSWDLKTMLLVSDCWLHLTPDVRISYHKEMVEVAADDVYYGTELTEKDVVQLFFIIRLSKTSPENRGVISKLLRTAAESLNSLTWAEIANICFGMVKMTIFREELDRNFFNALSQKFIDGLRKKEIDMYCTNCIMRCLARCYFEDVETFDALAEYLTPVLQSGMQDTQTSEKYKQLHIGHIAMAYGKVRMFHKPLMDAIVDHVLYSDSRKRTKDIHLLLWAFGRLHYKPPEEIYDRFFNQLIQEVQCKVTLRDTYPETYLGTLVSLTFLGIYPDALINGVFSPTYLKICESEYETKQSMSH